MSIRLKPYPRYKEPGAPWLGKIPAHWALVRSHSVFSERIERGFESEPLLSVTIRHGVVCQDELLQSTSKKDTSNEDKSNYKLVQIGDLAYNKMRMWQGSVGRSAYRGIVSPAYIVIHPRDSSMIDAFYYHYLFRTPEFMGESYRHSYGICDDQLSLRYKDFKTIQIPVLPVAEQTQIARFARGTDLKVGCLVRAKRRQIKLLNEQKQVIINQAVTRGLDPSVQMKRSEIDWVRDIPEHWKSVRVGMIASSLQTGPFGSQLHAHEYKPNGIPVINPAHMINGKIHHDPYRTVGVEKANKLSRHRLKVGDIIFARRGELGRCALVRDREAGWLCGTGSLRMRLREEVACPQYMLQLFLSRGVAEWLSLQSVGSTMENLNTGILARLPLPLPPVDEQEAIADYLAKHCVMTDRVIENTQRQISLLQEYRTRLIADVVTGRLDVRDVELPDVDAMEGFDEWYEEEEPEQEEMMEAEEMDVDENN